MSTYLISFEKWFDCDEWRTIEADSTKNAAIEAAKLYDEAEDYPILGSTTGTLIRVRSTDHGLFPSETFTFKVMGEAVPTYSAEVV